MVRSERNWDAVSSFCEAVMLAKEEAGRVGERTSRPSGRERHSGHRGSHGDLRPPRIEKPVEVRELLPLATEKGYPMGNILPTECLPET
uniref:SFRICE_028329 n=1 Tax=Spodoptera frugiperda TaxID=7108 RepID=A0A2H1WAH4_SPOFR